MNTAITRDAIDEDKEVLQFITILTKRSITMNGSLLYVVYFG